MNNNNKQMEKFLDKYRIPTARANWHGYDGGVYFVTICTHCRKHYLGEIENGEMKLSIIGNYADKCWREIPQHFPDAEIPLWVVMPNHIHGIITIRPSEPIVETQNFASLQIDKQTASIGNKFGPQSMNLASIIRGFKIGVTKYANTNNIPFAWQTRFHDRIVRDQHELNRIAHYIENNVSNWQTDVLNIIE